MELKGRGGVLGLEIRAEAEGSRVPIPRWGHDHGGCGSLGHHGRVGESREPEGWAGPEEEEGSGNWLLPKCPLSRTGLVVHPWVSRSIISSGMDMMAGTG